MFSWRSTPGQCLMAACLLPMTVAASARPAMYVPDHQWTKEAWQCKKQGVSLIEIERVRDPSSTSAVLKVNDLQINGRKIQSSSVEGLDIFIASLQGVRTITSGCGWTGEFVIIFGTVPGRAFSEPIERREFFVPYVR